VLSVQRVAVVEDEQRANIMLPKFTHQRFITLEVVLAVLHLCEFPFEISSNPPKPCVRNHFYSCWIGIDEVHVDAEGLADRERLGRWLPTAFAVNGPVIG